MDSSKSPQQNADLYFKKYRKLKRAKQIAQERLEELNQKLDYLKSIETAVANSDTKQEFEEIYQELTSLDNTADNINKTVKSRKKLIPSSPFISISTVTIHISAKTINKTIKLPLISERARTFGCTPKIFTERTQ